MMAALLRLLRPRRHTPEPAPDLMAAAPLAYGEGLRVGTGSERVRCATIMQSPVADHNRASAEVLAFGTDMDAPAALRLLTELANLGEAQQRTGLAAAHYAHAARTINERKPHP